MERVRQADEYGSAMGETARERQERLARERHACCGERKQDGHHVACAFFKPKPIDGQTTLA